MMTMKTYNNETDLLRQISIVDYLDNQGFKPVKHHSNEKELLYFSPMRNETKPSFSVNTEETYGMTMVPAKVVTSSRS